MPPKTQPEIVALGAAGSLRINDRTSVLSSTNTPALVSNLGSIETNIGVSAVVGNTWTNAMLALRDRATIAGFLSTQGGLQAQNQTTIMGGMYSTTVPSIPALASWTVTVPSTSAGNITLAPDVRQVLAPGRFGAVTVNSRAVLSIGAGTYFFDALDLEPQSVLDVDAAAGPTLIYLQGNLIFRGGISIKSGAAGDLMFAYTGSGTAFLEAPFRGTMVAPNGTVVLASLI
jgi:hypothetical protein